MGRIPYIVILLACILGSFTLNAQTDSISLELQGATIVQRRNTSPIKGNLVTGITFTPKSLQSFPKLLGESDPIRAAQSLPGVQTTGGAISGLYVQGCDDSHNRMTIAGAPIYALPRTIGFLPIINDNHFNDSRLEFECRDNHIGGSLSFETADTLTNGVRGDFALGMVACRGTVTIPVSEKVTVSASARQSLINIFYPNVLKFGEIPIRYDFTDVNAAVLWKPDDRNTFDANIFFSNDKPEIDYIDYGISLNGGWRQGMANIRWRHKGENVKSEHQIFVTGHDKSYELKWFAVGGKMPSDIYETGWKSDFQLPLRFNLGLDLSFFSILPQNPMPDFTYRGQGNTQQRQRSFLASTRLEKKFTIDFFTAIPSLTLSGYKEFGYDKVYLDADPEISLEFNLYNYGKIYLKGGRKHQYYSQTGLCSSGIPVRFWIASGHYVAPQESYFVDLSHTVDFLGGAYSLTTQVYWKRLFNQVEFNGFLFDFITSDYKLEDFLLPTSGYNFGGNLMFSKNSGNVTGWLSYSFGRALRETDRKGYPPVFPASYERIHELDAVVSWKIGSFELGGTFVVASGVPFTAVNSYYIISERIIADYQAFNSSRLKPYLRLDLSANYNFKSIGKYQHGINFSIYNATARNNEYMNYLAFSDDGTYRYKPAYMIIPLIPSISYFCKF